MELKEYVKKSLLEIAEGVDEAIKESAGKGYYISPADKDTPAMVKFRISVEASVKGGLSLKVIDSGLSEHSSNTLEFEIPVILPVSITEAYKKRELIMKCKPKRIPPEHENV